MQELIQNIVDAIITVEDKKKHIDEALLILARTFKNRSDLVVKQILVDNAPLLHLMKISAEAEKISYHPPLLASLRVRALNVLIGIIRDFEKSIQLREHLQRDFDHGVKLSVADDIMHNTDSLLFHMVYAPDYDKGLIYGLKAVELIEAEEAMWEEKLRLYANLIQYYTIVGKMDECQTFIDKGEQIFSAIDGDAYKALYVFAVSMFYMDLGDFDKTIDLIRSNLALFESQEFYLTFRFFPIAQLAEALIKKGDLAEGQKMIDLAEKYAKQFYNDDSSNFNCRLNVLRAFNQLASKEHYAVAKSLLESAISQYAKNFYGSDKHRWQAFAHLILGKLHYQNNQYDLAKEQLLLSEQIYNKIVKNRSIDDVSDLYKTLALLGVDAKD